MKLNASIEIKTKLRLLMEYINVIIVVLLGISLYLLYNHESQKKPPQKIEYKKNDKTFLEKIKKYTGKYIVGAAGKKYPYHMDYALDPEDMFDPITENQYHPDYVEVLSVLNKIIKPSIFNPAALPIVTQTNGEKREVFPIANRFVFDLSRKAGVSLKLVDIIYIKKYITEDQEKMKFDLVIQKETPIPSKMKMLLRVSIIYNTNNVIDENNFFDEAWSTRLTKKPILDEAFVLGYSTGYYDIESQAQTEYYAFKNVDENNFMDESTVDNVVRSVRRKHALETGCLNVTWDEDGRDYWVNDLDISNWGTSDRRGTHSNFTKYPKPCDTDQSNELYGAIGTKIIDI
jgi:hypothetical protein